MRAIHLTPVLVAAVVVSGCAGPPTSADTAPVPSTPVALEAIEEGPPEDVPSALDDPTHPDLPEPLVSPDRIISGGPPPDGIPAIDEPLFEIASSVSWLTEDEPVIALQLGDHHRAYPIQVLMWHEIVNDTVDGRPVAVTYCPLCNSALAFDRQVDDRLLSFGTSGSLYLSALVMYDRQTESLWSQVERTALAGELTGTELDLVPVTMVRWSDWLESHPDGYVLSRDTGFDRAYGTNPYVGYDELGSDSTFLDEESDGRFPAKERIVTFPGADEALAVLLRDLADAGTAQVTVDGNPVVLFSAPGLASALADAEIADGQRISATAAFDPHKDGQTLTFEAAQSGDAEGVVAIDTQTGSSWNILGEAIDGPLAGELLTQVPHLDTFWFAHAAFRPDTSVADLSD